MSNNEMQYAVWETGKLSDALVGKVAMFASLELAKDVVDHWAMSGGSHVVLDGGMNKVYPDD